MKALQEDEPLRGHLREFEEAGVPAVDCHPAFLERLENEPDAELFSRTTSTRARSARG